MSQSQSYLLPGWGRVVRVGSDPSTGLQDMAPSMHACVLPESRSLLGCMGPVAQWQAWLPALGHKKPEFPGEEGFLHILPSMTPLLTEKPGQDPSISWLAAIFFSYLFYLFSEKQTDTYCH